MNIQIEKAEAIRLMKLQFKLRSVISSLDELQDCKAYKHRLKRSVNILSKELERSLQPVMSSMEAFELESYNIIVNEIDEFINNIEIQY